MKNRRFSWKTGEIVSVQGFNLNAVWVPERRDNLISEDTRWSKHDFHWQEESEDSSVWSGLISLNVTQTHHDLLNRELLLSVTPLKVFIKKVVIRPEQVCVHVLLDPKLMKLKDKSQLWSRWDLGRIWWENRKIRSASEQTNNVEWHILTLETNLDASHSFKS